MRTKPATRYNAPSEHNQFGIYNWFRLKGVKDMDAIRDTIYCFCEENGFDMKGFEFKGVKEKAILNFVGNRFQKFATYAGKFLRESNYIKDEEGNPKYLQRIFIRALPTDNPYLLKNDPDYLTKLEALPLSLIHI